MTDGILNRVISLLLWRCGMKLSPKNTLEIPLIRRNRLCRLPLEPRSTYETLPRNPFGTGTLQYLTRKCRSRWYEVKIMWKDNSLG